MRMIQTYCGHTFKQALPLLWIPTLQCVHDGCSIWTLRLASASVESDLIL